MTVQAASKILGYSVEVNRLPDGRFEAESNWELGTERVAHLQRGGAIRGLVNRIYRLRSREVMRRQGWKCWECGAVKPLQADHQIPRARGRRDALSNLTALCAACHEREHQGGRKKS